MKKNLFIVLFLSFLLLLYASVPIWAKKSIKGTIAQGRSKVINSSILNRLEQGESYVNVIVLLKGYKNYIAQARADKPAQMVSIQSEIQSRGSIVLNQLDSSHFKLKHRFKNIMGFSGRVSQEGIQILMSLPDVELIEEDKILVAHLAQGIPLMNALAVRFSYDGSGASIAIVDTGIDYTHSVLGSGGFPNTKVIGGYDFGDSDTNPMDCEGHGTSVAGISAGTQAAGPGDYIGGVAHNAKLYALKIVSGCSGTAFTSDIAAAWDWAVSHKNDDPNNPILVINTSFGGGYYTTACDSSSLTLANAANNAVANGITLFSSSGNDGYTDGISMPACVSNVISVGAVYDANIGGWTFPGVPCTDFSTAADQVTCYSNSADFLDILAPSHFAYTTRLGGSYTSNSPGFGGTSASSPYAAGAAAILQNYAMSTTGSYYAPAEIKSRLVNNGEPVTDSKNNITKPRVNVGNAIGGGGTPEITSPVPGSTLSGSTETFNWTDNGTAVSQWWLWVGTSQGGQDILNSGSLGSSTSTTVSGLPTNGSQVYVRLWYKTGGSWQHEDFQYTAYTCVGCGGTPEITSPVPGSTLSGSTETFYWTDNGTTVSQWWLWVGTSQGGQDILNSGSLGSSTSTTVSGLPTNGSQVYVRLWYRTGGSWQHEDFQYTASSGGSVSISGYVRTSGSIGISGVTMSGDSCSSTDSSGYYNCTVTSGWSGTITPSKSCYIFSPTNISYSSVITNQINQNYTGTYTCSGTPEIISPVPGSTLSGSTETFYWTDNGTAVSQWWLWVGPCSDAAWGGCGDDIFNSGSLGSSTSTTVNSLPTDGSTVYVRLWYKTGGSWQSEVFQYTTGL